MRVRSVGIQREGFETFDPAGPGRVGACEAVATNIEGTLAIPHAYGRLQFGADLDLHLRTMIGTGGTRPFPRAGLRGREDARPARPYPPRFRRKRAKPSGVSSTNSGAAPAT